MAENSKIEWCHHTFNPWIGCAKVSDGCKNCYAENLMDTRWGKVEWGIHGTRKRTSAALWRKPIQWNKQAEAEGVRYRVFCASLADVFEDREEVRSWRKDLLALIEQTPSLDWLLLTKRPENVLRLIEQAQEDAGAVQSARGWLIRNVQVWLGTSVENQALADERIPHLLRCPARVRFLSCEPLLGPVDLDYDWLNPPNDDPLPLDGRFRVRGIEWVICGGESGPKARPMHPDWARSLRDQCLVAGVPFFFKQWGAWLPWEPDAQPPFWNSQAAHFMDGHAFPWNINGGDMPASWREGWIPNGSHCLFQRVGKKRAGRLLDGRTWDQFPDTHPIEA